MKLEVNVPDERVDEFAAVMRDTFGAGVSACGVADRKSRHCGNDHCARGGKPVLAAP